MSSDVAYVRGHGPEAIGGFRWMPRPKPPTVFYRTYSLQVEVQFMRDKSVSRILEALPRASPSRGASITAFASVVATLIGVAGQIVNNGSVAFAMLGAFGLATLSVIVLIHQRGS
jgi:hypothetical protein